MRTHLRGYWLTVMVLGLNVSGEWNFMMTDVQARQEGSQGAVDSQPGSRPSDKSDRVSPNIRAEHREVAAPLHLLHTDLALPGS